MTTDRSIYLAFSSACFVRVQVVKVTILKTTNFLTIILFQSSKNVGGKLRSAVANVMKYDIVEHEFELHLRNKVHFRTNILGKTMIPFIPLVMG